MEQHTLGEEQADTLVLHDTLDHGEPLLVVAASDLEDVALPLVAEGISGDLLGNALVVEGAPACDATVSGLMIGGYASMQLTS